MNIAAFDYTVENHGSIYLLRPVNDQARQNLDEHTGDEAQFFGDALVVEHRYIAPLCKQLQQEGFIIQ